MTDEPAEHAIELTAELVAAYVSRNSVPLAELPSLIRSVHSAMVALGSPAAEPETAPPVPAVPVKKSIHDGFIVCLEDGKRFKSIKRHLAAVHGMMPDEYRAKWGLPASYPMVAPAYAKQRSALAVNLGLGRRVVDESVDGDAGDRGGREADEAA